MRRQWGVAGLTIVACMVASTIGRVFAQSQTAAEKARGFEVASIKLHDPGDQRVMMVGDPSGRFTARNVPLRLLIRTAYGLQDDQIVDGPDWITSEKFDVVAKAEDGAPMSALLPNLQSLLADRFRLVTHRDTRELSVYTLTQARSDSVLGPQLQRSTCQPSVVPGDAAPMNASGRVCGSISTGFGRLTLSAQPIQAMAQYLSPLLSRVVLDRTGLTGAFEIDLQWTQDRLPPRPAGAPADQPIVVNGTPIDPNGPSIFTAIREQLGLKLEATRAQTDVLVIDRVERPTPD